MAELKTRTFNSLFFYDLETSGIIRSGHQYPQMYDIGYVITDDDLNIAEEGNIIVKPRIDIIPSPGAFAITRLDIEKLERVGIPEYEAISKFQSLITKTPKTLVSGYNSMTFDDELTRHTLYRNLKNPYLHEWQNGNARMDVYALVQMAYAFSPSVLKWPLNEDGTAVSLKLENIAKENGVIHEQAHDALSDVKATIAIAKIIKDKNPSLWDYYLWLTDKKNALSILTQNDVVFQTTPFFGKECRMTKPVKPIIVDRKNQSLMHCIDLSASPESIQMLAQMTPDEIRELMFTKKEDLPEGSPAIPLTRIYTNKMPNIRKANDQLLRTCASKFAYDEEKVRQNIAFINQNKHLARLIQEATMSDFENNEDPEFNIYSGFPSKKDDEIMTSLHAFDSSNPGKTRFTEIPIAEWSKGMTDPSKGTLALRAKYANYLQDLIVRNKAPINELKTWFRDLENRIVKGENGSYTFKNFEEDMRQVRIETPLDEEQIEVLDKLEKYVESRKDQLREIKQEIRSMVREGQVPEPGH